MISVYIHIPFCEHICTYCDFSKIYYQQNLVDKYLSALEREVNYRYQGEKIKTIYIGGGTPSSLNIEQLNKLFTIINKFDLSLLSEFTFECNIENITEDKLLILKNNHVNRLSIGIQTIDAANIKLLNRHHQKKLINDQFQIIKQLGFKNINIDLIYAIPGESVKTVINDLNYFISLGITHISCYSLIIEPNTKLYIDKYHNINEETDEEMYHSINQVLLKNNFHHYEISNYSLEGYQSEHNLVYWNNEEYYGFGLSAVSYLENQRITNTRNINKYLKDEHSSVIETVSKTEQMENEMILGLRKTDGIDINKFYLKYHQRIEDTFPLDDLINKQLLIKENDHLKINDKYLYLSNEILINFIGGNNE